MTAEDQMKGAIGQSWEGVSVNPIARAMAAHNDYHNPNCDGGHCGAYVRHPLTDEVRVLPMFVESPQHGNMILCRACYENEMEFRRDRNAHLSADCQFELPSWDSLKVYAS